MEPLSPPIPPIAPVPPISPSPVQSSDEAVKKILPWLVAIAFFMEALDTTILNTAVPKIAQALQVLPLGMKSVLSSYTLSLAVFIPISSWVADRYGTRKVFTAAIAIFTLGSFLCGLATSLPMLVFCRVLQGLGGAMMVPVGRLTMVRTFAKSELVRAMSFLSIPALIGPMLGPLAGGLIVEYFHWRMIFFVNLPIGIAGLWLIYHYLPDYYGTEREPLDFVGFVLFSSGIALASYILEVFGEHTLSAIEISCLLGTSIILLIGYFFHSRTYHHPLLRLNLLRIRTLRIGVMGSFITRLGVGGMPFLLPLLYQLGLGYTPIQSGLLIMPQSVTAMIFKMLVPRILTRFGYRHILLINTVIIGVLIWFFALIGPLTPVWVIIVQACLFGFFSSTQFTCMNTLVYADVAPAQTSMASTIISTVQQMSMSFGVAMASLVATFFIPNRMLATPDQILGGIHHAFIFLGAITILSSLGFHELKSSDGESISQYHRHVH
jgi:EmrB/QacA subfamily drug resistance transporter